MNVHGHGVEQAAALAGRFVEERHPRAVTAFLGGSRARGTAAADSDYDVVILFEHLPAGAWRETVAFEGGEFELFLHDFETLVYFFREVDRPSGMPGLPRMISEGVTVWGAGSVLEGRARGLAERTLAEGPPVLEGAALRMRRYAITDLAMALKAERPEAVRWSAGCKLHEALGDFALRAAGQWSGSGKSLPAALRAFDPALEERFVQAFGAFFRLGTDRAVQALVEEILLPYGGRLREGFWQHAPVGWCIEGEVL